MSENIKKHIRIFYCYSHKDRTFRDQLEQHLSERSRSGLISTWYDRDILPGSVWEKETGWSRSGLISTWYDRDILPGSVWEKEIGDYLDTAQLILLLISADFMHSDYCYSLEMKRALERHAKGEARVIPIIVRPTYLKDTPLSYLQALPRNGKPITTWYSQDEALADVVMGIERVIRELLTTFEKSMTTQAPALASPLHTQERSPKQEEATESQTHALAPPVQRIDFSPSFIALFTHLVGGIFTKAADSARLAFYSSSASVSRFCSLNALALRAYEYAINLEQNTFRRSRLYMHKGWVLFKIKRYAEALDAYSAAIHLDPNLSEAYRARGKVYQQLAQQSYEESKRLSKEAYEKAEGLGADSGAVNGCAMSPDGCLIVSASADHTLKVWEAATGAERLSLRGHTSWVNGCAVSPDGRLIVSASVDQTLRVWEAATKHGLMRLPRPGRWT